MSDIKEVDVMADFGLTLDHFYSIVKRQIGNLQSGQYLQLQATAIPLDISETYPWFSLGNINAFFDVRMDPTPVADNITLLANAKLSSEYLVYMADMLSLVEHKELDAATAQRIEALQTKILNNGSRINALIQTRLNDWVRYADGSMLDRGSIAQFTHWAQGHYTTREIVALSTEQSRDQALIEALRLRRYGDPSHQAVVDAYAAVTSPASRMRYPRFEDSLYGDEAKKFNVVYFASLPDNESSLFANRQLMTTRSSLGQIAGGTIGSFSDTVTRGSSASSSIKTDWSGGGTGGWGPFKLKAKASSHTSIKNDFASTQNITVGAKSLQAIPIDSSAWFNASMFSHKLVTQNRRMFEPYLGPAGTLLYYPTHLIVARGFNLKFTSSQNWSYDYAHDFSAKGSASARIFGVGWGLGGSYSQSKREQKVETRGHELILDDRDNIRIIGYVVTKNPDLGHLFFEQNKDLYDQNFSALIDAEKQIRSLGGNTG